jgi:lantibiotic biosynthesis protein
LYAPSVLFFPVEIFSSAIVYLSPNNLFTTMYTPVISDTDKLGKVLTSHIENLAVEVIEDKDNLKRIDVFGGKAGTAMMFAWLGVLYPETKYSDQAFEMLEEMIGELGEIQWSLDMGAELAGTAYVLQHLQNAGIIDEADDLGLDAVDDFLLNSAPVYAEAKNWDPILGIGPMGVYFLERYRKTGDAAPLEKIAQLIIDLSTKTEGYDVWVTVGHRFQPKDCYNFGTAHGMPGLISLLSKIYALGIKTNELQPLVNSCIQFLLSKQNGEEENSQFPSYLFTESEADESKLSRLGWCYGDLGIAFALIHWGQATKQQHLVDKGLAIAEKTTHRNLESAACTDASLCHGSVGLAHLYNRLYQHSNNAIFKNASLQWVEHSLEKFYRPELGVGAYPFMSFNMETNKAYPTSNSSLLEGGTGVALMYASLMFEAPASWDEIFFSNL